MEKLDAAFAKLKSDGKNSVDGFIAWMKESKLIDETKEAEEKARKLFADVKDETNVELQKFREALSKIAEDQNKSMADFTKLLSEQGPELVNAIVAGASAFKDAFEKK